MEESIKIGAEKFADTLAEISVLLISNGANSSRTSRNLRRIATAFGFRLEHFFSHSAVVLTLEDPFTHRKTTVVKSIPHHGVNFSIVSEISILSWEAASHKLAFPDLEAELKDIRQMNSYPEWMKFLFIGLATAALAKIFDGSNAEFLVTFLAAIIGMYVRRFLVLRSYTSYVSVFFAAFLSTTVVNIFRSLGMETYDGALTSCVLWLIPGVPLINGFLDILSGYIVSGWAKVSMGFILVFMIAVGFYFSLFLFGYGFNI